MSWLRAELRSPGRSQTALAQFMGIDKTAVTKIIQGKRAVKVEESEAIQEYLASTKNAVDQANRRVERKIAKPGSDRADGIIDKHAAQLAIMNALSAGNDSLLIRTTINDLADALKDLVIRTSTNRDAFSFSKIRVAENSPDVISIMAAMLSLFGIMPNDITSTIYLIADRYLLFSMEKNSSEDAAADYYRDIITYSSHAPLATKAENRALYSFIMTSISISLRSNFDNTLDELLTSLREEVIGSR